MGLWTAVEVVIVVAILIVLLAVTISLLAEMWRKRRPAEMEPLTGIAVADLNSFPNEQFYAVIGDGPDREVVKVIEVNGRRLPEEMP